MKTYSVKQIADMLKTNPETVRRWIRDNKLKAVQASRKNGNVVSESELEKFLNSTPRYLNNIAPSLISASPAFGIGALVGVATAALLGIIKEKSDSDLRITPEELKKCLKGKTVCTEKIISQKKELIKKTEIEIAELEKEVKQYRYLMEHDEVLSESIKIFSEENVK